MKTRPELHDYNWLPGGRASKTLAAFPLLCKVLASIWLPDGLLIIVIKIL